MKIHFANVIPFLRTGKMQGSKFVKGAVLYESIDSYLKPLIKIVNPRIIITLGAIPLMAVFLVFEIKEHQKKALKILVDKAPLKLDNNIDLFPMFHCGSMGINFNRNMALQMNDWEKLKNYYIV